MHAPPACYYEMGGSCFGGEGSFPWGGQQTPFFNYPDFGGVVLPETVETVDNPAFTVNTLEPLVSVEARVNYTKAQKARKKSNLATLTIGTNS